MNNLIEFKRGSSKKKTGLIEVYVFNQSDPVYTEKEAFISIKHIISAAPYENENLGPSVELKLTEDGMNLINEVSDDDEFNMLILYINDAPFMAYHGIHKLESPEASITVTDMDFAEMVQTLVKIGKESES